MTEDALAMMARGLALGLKKEELRVGMPSLFPEDVEPLPQSVSTAFEIINSVA